MEQETNRLRRSGSLSSLFENFDRSSYSCYSQTSNTSTDEEEIEEDGDFLQKKDFNHKSYDFADDGLIE